MSVPDETLDIKPILPVGATPWTPDFSFGDGVLNPGGEKNPEAAAQARAMIAAAGHRPAETTAIPDAPYLPAQPASKPTSPAHQQSAKHRPSIKTHVARWRPAINAVGVFLLLLLIFKAPVFYSQLKFQFSKPTPAQSSPVVAAPTSVSKDPTLTIPKINVQAPIVFEPSFDEARVMKGLERGVVHYGNTARPGEVGNAVITGHSSNDWWQPGNYKFVFVLLGKLVPGDPIMINYEGVQYKYEVTERRIVEPTDVSVIAPTGSPTLTLITCWPVGTNLKREIIHAKQVNPVPGADGPLRIAKTPDTQGITLPGSSRTLTQQIGDFWKSITGAFSQTPTEVNTDTQPR